MAKNKKKGNKKKQNQFPAATKPEETKPLTETNEVNENTEPHLDNIEKTDVESVFPPKSESPKQEESADEAEEEKEDDESSPENVIEQTKANTTTVPVSEEGASEEIINLKKKIELLKEQLSKKQEPTENTTISDITDSDTLEELEKVKGERDHLESQYNTLLSRISSMKNVFSKMKESQEELENVQEQLKEYESQNTKMKNKITSINKDNEELSHTVATLNKEFSTLEDDYQKLQNQCEEYENEIRNYDSKLEDNKSLTDYKLKDYEQKIVKLNTQVEEMIIILENDKQDIRDLKDDKEELQSHLEKSKTSENHLTQTISELETSFQSNEKLFKEELKERDLQIKALRVQLDNNIDMEKTHVDEINKLKSDIEKLNGEVALKDKFEKETKDQALQIGKLRHEAIILNEHLKKALGMLKKSSDSETVDRDLISNLLISFVSIPRADPKKFEVLQLLSNFLNWDDEKKQQAGLMNNPNKVQKNASASRTQSFVSMWTDFLEKESELS